MATASAVLRGVGTLHWRSEGRRWEHGSARGRPELQARLGLGLQLPCGAKASEGVCAFTLPCGRSPAGRAERAEPPGAAERSGMIVFQVLAGGRGGPAWYLEGKVGTTGKCRQSFRMQSEGKSPHHTPPTFAPGYVRAGHSRAGHRGRGQPVPPAVPGWGADSPRAPAVPSARPQPPAGAPSGRAGAEKAQVEGPARGWPLAVPDAPGRQGRPGPYGRAGGALRDAAAAPPCPWSPGALPALPATFRVGDPGGTAILAPAPRKQRVRRPDGKNTRTTVHIPFTTSLKPTKPPFPTQPGLRGSLSLPRLPLLCHRRDFRPCLGGWHQDHTRSGCGSAGTAGHAGPPCCSQPGRVQPGASLCFLHVPTWL